MLLILALAIVGVVAFRATTADERERFLELTRSTLHPITGFLRRRRPDWVSFCEALLVRTPIAIMTPIFLLLGLAIFVLMRFDAVAGGGSSVALLWGSSFGPRTTNGEWWRLVTSMFIHPTILLLVVNVTGLVSVAPMLERYVGTVAFLAVYFTTGLIAGVVNLRCHPVVVSSSVSAPIFGLYGLLLASFLWSRFGPPADPEASSAQTEPLPIVIPLSAITRIAPGAVAFAVCNMASDDLAIAAELTAFCAGFVGGLLITRHARHEKPSVRQVGLMAVGATAIATALAVPVWGIADVRPEIERVVALEDRSAGVYRTAYQRFTRGQATAEALAQLIDRVILPDLQAADGRLKALQRVPREHQTLVADAEEYVHLRVESWRLRAQALRKAGAIPDRDAKLMGPSADAVWRARAEAQYRANMAMFGSSESAELAARQVLQRIKP
jgi:membrane associated rhomboid family serine protease